MYAIETENLTKDFSIGFWRPRPYRALDGLTFSVEPGETFGFLGPNGAGKTTTLKLLMQLIHPTSGRAEILGRPVGDADVKRRIGYLPESPYFYDYLTAEELLSYFASLFGYAPADRRRRVAALLDEVGIGGERRLQLRKFSKGMLQRLGIAQAILNDPEVVFLDEPMSGLDPLGRREVRSLILKLRDRGCTVFFSSHVLADAEALCNRVGILARGTLVAAGRITELHAFKVKGWELVVDQVPASALEKYRARVVRVTRIADERYALDLSLEPGPDLLLKDLIADGAHLVSLNPVRETLEDFFVEQVSKDIRIQDAVRDRGVLMRAVGIIAANVFKESVRDKVLYNLVFFAVLLMGVSYLLGQLTAGQDIKIIKDLGLAAMSVFGVFIAVFIGIGLVFKEVDRRTIYSLLSKPILRQELIIGKYLGLMLTLLVNVAVMTVAYYAVLAYMAWSAGGWMLPGWEAPALDPNLLKAVGMIFLQLMIVTAIALLFSTFSSPMLAAALTFGLYIAGHFNEELRNFDAVVSSPPAIYLAKALYYVLPNLAPLDIKTQVVHAMPVSTGLLLWNSAYAFTYVGMLLLTAVFIFSRRDFK